MLLPFRHNGSSAMLLTITNTKSPATDLGYLLHKNPSRVQTFELSFGKAHVFYPEASADRCTAALLLDVDPVGLVRTRRGPSGEGGMLDQYVNDRPYVASSFMSVAIARIFNSALAGNSKDRPELVTVALPLTARIAVLPCRGGEEVVRRLFDLLKPYDHSQMRCYPVSSRVNHVADDDAECSRPV